MFGIDEERFRNLAEDVRQASKLRQITNDKLAAVERSHWDIEASATTANKMVNAQRDRIDALLEYLGLEEQEVEAHTKIVKVKK